MIPQKRRTLPPEELVQTLAELLDRLSFLSLNLRPSAVSLAQLLIPTNT